MVLAPQVVANSDKLSGIEPLAEVNAVDSVFGRTGAITSDFGDYAATQVSSDSGFGVQNDLNTLAVAVSKAVTDTQHRKMYGYDIHIDDTVKATAYTANDGVKTQIPNNGSVIMQDLDPSITDLVTAQGGAILDQENALYSIGVQMTAKPATRDKDYYLLFEIPDGISPGVDLLVSKRFLRFAKNIQQETISMSFVLPCTAATVNKEILPYIETDGTACDFWATNITVTKLNGPVIP